MIRLTRGWERGQCVQRDVLDAERRPSTHYSYRQANHFANLQWTDTSQATDVNSQGQTIDPQNISLACGACGACGA
jgi:hypothetical protein